MPRLAGLGGNVTAYTVGINVRFLKPITASSGRGWTGSWVGGRKIVVGTTV
ncbi:hypothetical protein MN608_09390 [Microdochium nivale]|nr:hypothetical protein MN608_09390 [Microdochium nivale]